VKKIHIIALFMKRIVLRRREREHDASVEIVIERLALCANRGPKVLDFRLREPERHLHLIERPIAQHDQPLPIAQHDQQRVLDQPLLERA
jgi:hypothetical protein